MLDGNRSLRGSVPSSNLSQANSQYQCTYYVVVQKREVRTGAGRDANGVSIIAMFNTITAVLRRRSGASQYSIGPGLDLASVHWL